MTSSRQKRKTSERFQPAKRDQIFVEAGKVKRQPAKCRQCRLCGEPWTELLQIGLEATTFVLIRQMLKVAFEAVEVFWPVCGSYSPCADIFFWTPSCPSHRHGKPGDFGSLFFFCAFSAFSKIFGATFEKNTNFVMRLSMIAKSASTRPSPF